MRRGLPDDRVVLARDREERHADATEAVVRARILVIRIGGREGPRRRGAAELGDDEFINVYESR